MSDLYRLVYASRNVLQGTDAEIAEAVSQILAASQRNNAEAGVTGALMFNAGAFAQVLEGPQPGVESTFERIQCDPRHGDVTVLQCGPAESRGFTNWSMAFVGQSEAGRTRWDGMAAASGFDLSRLDGDAVFAMLHGLVLDEEGLPAAAAPASAPKAAAEALKATGPAHKPAAEAPKAPAGMDAERVRAELPQPGQALRAAPDSPATPEAEASRSAAALAILRAALAEERQRTTDLRGELDALRIAEANHGEALEALRRERDLWLQRAQALATLIRDEADAVLSESAGPRPLPIRAVA